MADLLTPADLANFAEIDPGKAQDMIDDVMGLAILSAPCLGEDNLDPLKAKAAKAILRGAVLRWNEAGQGGRTQVSDTVGPFQHSETFDNSTPRRSLLWPSEIAQLQAICTGGGDRKAWSYDTAGGGSVQHADTCAINLGATFCDCGAIYTGAGPLWGSGCD
ncbi:hypothetical protein [Mycobacterium aquaticum]|uniref:Head-to-tail adaptor n=1 Tax=Mycobacterium aquaticum TaxID=1927124 RepID=A0A1X0A0I7_9MYCO|nr:hypothetical protein [Mycobacterium aquaticum]ORA23405.1 hypothetical protein BST13_35215 [Mycobacterium aquaticum]